MGQIELVKGSGEVCMLPMQVWHYKGMETYVRCVTLPANTHKNGMILWNAITQTKCWTLTARDVIWLTRVSTAPALRTQTH